MKFLVRRRHVGCKGSKMQLDLILSELAIGSSCSIQNRIVDRLLLEYESYVRDAIVSIGPKCPWLCHVIGPHFIIISYWP